MSAFGQHLETNTSKLNTYIKSLGAKLGTLKVNLMNLIHHSQAILGSFFVFGSVISNTGINGQGNEGSTTYILEP